MTGVFLLILFLWKSVSILQLDSLRSMPDAESLIKATQGRFMESNIGIVSGTFSLHVISWLLFLQQACGNAAFTLSYFMG